MFLAQVLAYLGINGGDGRIVTDICTDSRKVTPGCLYVPLKGENFDGHDFINDALAKGAIASLTQGEEGNRRFHVDSTLEALGKIASGYRQACTPCVVGVTGSVGKTTTKDMIAHVLDTQFRTHKTMGNFNNEIGLPKTLLSMPVEAEVTVVEMGMSHKGEISRLSCIACPDMGVITNIGTSHIEYLGSREGIRDAKLEIIDGLPKDGLLIINGDEPLLWEKKDCLPCRVCTFALDNQQADYIATHVQEREDGVSFVLRGVPFSIACPGLHQVKNALVVAAVGEAMGMSLEKISEGLQSFRPQSAMRQAITEVKGIKVVTDCYNASPESMSASFSVCKKLSVKGRRIAVLGVMRELGAYSQDLHAAVGKEADAVFDELLFYGEGAEHYSDQIKKGRLCYTHEELLEAIREIVSIGDLVLFKGSRLNYLEKVAEDFQNSL